MSYKSIALLLVYTLSSHSIIAQTFQEKDDLMATIHHELRSPAYTREILPNDFSHLSQLLFLGASNNQLPLYALSVTKSFTKLVKRCSYISSTALSQLLQELPKQLLPYFALPSSGNYITNPALYDAAFADRFGSTINNLLYAQFSTKYEEFRQDPYAFLRTTSTNILAIAQEEMMQEQLRQNLLRFFEIALSKLIWNPTEQEATWFTTKRIAEQLAQLLEYNIIDDTNDLEDLYLTLLNRYCYFVEITATDMPSSFFAAVRNDLKSNDIVLFALAEQDTILESKLAYMQRTLIEAETAAYRYNSGVANPILR